MSPFDARISLKSFQEIGKLLISTKELPEILDSILKEIIKVLSLKGGTIRLVNDLLRLLAPCPKLDFYSPSW